MTIDSVTPNGPSPTRGEGPGMDVRKAELCRDAKGESMGWGEKVGAISLGHGPKADLSDPLPG